MPMVPTTDVANRAEHVRARLRRRAATGVACALALVASLLTIAPLTGPEVASAAPAKVRDPGRNSEARTGWWRIHGASTADVQARAAKGFRLVDLEVQSNSPLRFSAAFVKNQGDYGRKWWWYVDLTAGQVSKKLTRHRGRLIDIETYATPNGLRHAVVMVKNAGKARKAWWWYHGQTRKGVAQKAAAHGARIVDINRYGTPQGQRFTAIMVRNTGVDASAWWHYYRVGPKFIGKKLGTHNARLIDIERVGPNRYDVVMVRRPLHSWWWYHGLTRAGIGAKAAQHAARVYSVEPYVVNGKRRYAVLLMSNTNAATAEIRSTMEKGLSGGDYGAYLKRVGGPALVKLNADHAFEPASTIKVAHHLAVHRDWRDPGGQVATLDDIVTWKADKVKPTDRGRCAYDQNGNDSSIPGSTYRDPLRDVLAPMMQQSDNRMTDAVVNLLGFGAINQTMAEMGMSRSVLAHRIGCEELASPQPWMHNRLTLRDAGRLYEAVANGSALGKGTPYQNSFYDLMSKLPISSGSGIGAMIEQEAAAAGLTDSEVATFLLRTERHEKAGSYNICPDSGPCNPPHWWVRSAAGNLRLPFKDASGRPYPVDFVYGYFADELPVDCEFPPPSPATSQCVVDATAAAQDAYDTAKNQLLRNAIRAAIATW